MNDLHEYDHILFCKSCSDSKIFGDVWCISGRSQTQITILGWLWQDKFPLFQRHWYWGRVRVRFALFATWKSYQLNSWHPLMNWYLLMQLDAIGIFVIFNESATRKRLEVSDLKMRVSSIWTFSIIFSFDLWHSQFKTQDLRRLGRSLDVWSPDHRMSRIFCVSTFCSFGDSEDVVLVDNSPLALGLRPQNGMLVQLALLWGLDGLDRLDCSMFYFRLVSCKSSGREGVPACFEGRIEATRRCCMFSVVFVNECWINTLTNYTVNPGPTGLSVVGMPPKTSQSQIEAWPRCQITSWYGDDHQDMVVPCWVGFEIMFGHKMVACNVTLHGWDIGTSKLEQNLEPLSLEGVAAWTEREGHVRSCSHAYPLYSSLLMMTNDDVYSG